MFGHWKIDKTSDIPIYLQIAGAIEKDIVGGVIPLGVKLPSHRRMMELFGVSRNTVLAAVNILVKQNLVRIKPQSGILVSSKNEETLKSVKSPDWEKYFKQGMHEFGAPKRLEQLTVMGKAAGRVINISSAGLGMDFNLLDPIMDRLERNVLKKDLSTLIHFNKYGYLPLRRAIAERVASHGINVTENEVLIVPSVLQGINLSCMAFMSLGSKFVYETPNVINMDSIVRFTGCNLIPLPMDQYGIIPERLESVLKTKNCILYLNPTSQNPTGYTMPMERRQEVLSISNRYRTPIIEVDSLRDMWVGQPYPPSLRAIDKADSVIYHGSILRTLTFNLGVSWIIASQRVVESLSDIKAQFDLYPSLILQLIGVELLTSGRYDIFLQDVRSVVAKKRLAAIELVKKYFGSLASLREDNCNFYFWLEFNKCVNTKKLFEHAKGVEFYPGFFFDKSDTTHLSVCPSAISDEELEEGFARLSDCVRNITSIY